MTMALDQSKAADGEPWTTIRIKHEGLPVEWLEDMETWWAYQLSIARPRRARHQVRVSLRTARCADHACTSDHRTTGPAAAVL